MLGRSASFGSAAARSERPDRHEVEAAEGKLAAALARRGIALQRELDQPARRVAVGEVTPRGSAGTRRGSIVERPGGNDVGSRWNSPPLHGTDPGGSFTVPDR